MVIEQTIPPSIEVTKEEYNKLSKYVQMELYELLGLDTNEKMIEFIKQNSGEIRNIINNKYLGVIEAAKLDLRAGAEIIKEQLEKKA